MKITCQSCQAKYTIADEKVVGKTVKIKCKKCGATIVVSGTEASAATASTPGMAAPAAPPGPEEDGGSTRVFTEGSGAAAAEWTVNVTEDEQRPMSAVQIAAEYHRGVVTGDTYVWKDGMADWLPLSGVPELMAQVNALGPGAAAPAVAAPVAPAAPEPAPAPAAAFAPAPMPPVEPGPELGLGGTVMMAESSAADPTAAPSAAAAARRKAPGPGVDLFAPGQRPEPAPAAPATTATTSADRLVGERNENSVLFSISALTAAAAANKMGNVDEALLELGGPSPRRSGGGVDDIMNLGGGISAAPVLAPPPLLAPVVEAPPPPVPMAMPAMPIPDYYPQKKSKAGLVVGIVVGVLGLGGGVVFALSGGSRTNTDEATSTTATVTSAPTTAAVTTTTTTTQAPTQDTATPATSGAPAASGTAAVAATSKTGPGPGPGPKPGPSGKATAGPGPTAPTPPPTATAVANTGGGDFDRAAAMSSLGGAAGAVRKCKTADGPTGSGKVKVVFAPSGNVTTVTLESGPFGGTPLAGCIIGAFRGAKVPPFAGAPVSVSKSFSIN